jgi:Flp pilus assembly protein TadG
MLGKRFLLTVAASSALEFAAISPVMIATGLGMIDGWSLYSQSLGMHAALHAGAKYLIQGGTSEANAQAVVTAAWNSPPATHSVTVTKSCTCAAAAAVCTTLCAATNKPPITKYTLTASGDWSAPFNVAFVDLNRTLTETEVVRVR